MNRQSNHFSLRRCYPLLAAMLLVLVGCGGGSDNPSGGTTVPLVDLLPATTMGAWRWLPTQSQQVGALAAPESSVAPWRQHPVDILQWYAQGMNLEAAAEDILLAQDLPPETSFILLVRALPGQGVALVEGVETDTSEAYREKTLSRVTASGLILAALDDSLWVVGDDATVRGTVDAYLDGGGAIASSAIAPYLEVLDAGAAVSLVFGLNGLYRDVPTTGSGAYSLRNAKAITVTLEAPGQIAGGQLQIFADNSQLFAEKLLELLPDGNGSALQAGANSLDIDLGLLTEGGPQALAKTLFIDMENVDYAEAVEVGGNDPWLNFKVGRDPNSIFINFEFKDAAARANFEAQHLPAGFQLTPLPILERETPRFFLVLNVYQSSGGLVQGARAEWSVFVRDPDTGEPRFLVIQASAENISADSVNLLTPPEPVSHTLEPDAILSYVGIEDVITGVESTYFESRIDWPQSLDNAVPFASEFAVANDYIFWGNAVADRTLYNHTVFNRDAIRIPPGGISFEDNTPWAEFVNPDPVHTLVYQNPLDIVISPWWNLDADYLDVTPEYRTTLVEFKNGFYPALAQGGAAAAVAGTALALESVIESPDLPTAYYHFRLTDPSGLLQRLGADPSIEPHPVPLFEDEAAAFYISLAVSALQDDPCRRRAVWQTYVAGDDGRPQVLQLQFLGSGACLDPVALVGLPALVEHSMADSILATRLLSPFIQFDAALDANRGLPAVASRDWLEAGNTVCALNGVCDRRFLDGQQLLQPLTRLGAGDIQLLALATPWNDFIEQQPVAAALRSEPARSAGNRWANVLTPGL